MNRISESFSSTTPLLDSIQSAASQNLLEGTVKEGEQKEFKIVVKNKTHRFLIYHEHEQRETSNPGKRIKARYEGDFRIVIQKDSLELIQKLIYQTPEVIRFQCRDINDNLLLHILCWRGFVNSAAKHFTDKTNSVIQDKTGWTVLHYACHSDSLENVKLVFANGDKMKMSKIIDHLGNYPIDLTDSDIVRNFLTSSILDFQTVFRTSFRISERSS